MVQLHDNQSTLESHDVQVLIIGFEPERRARAWLRQAGVNFPFLLDMDRTVYRAYELERSLWRSWHPRNLWFYFKRMLRGASIPRFRADPTQMGGDFLIDESGTIRLAYYGEDATDRPAVDRLLEILGRMEDD